MECTHERMVDDAPSGIDGGWVVQGYVCADCGFQTVRQETYTPTDKPCPQCGQTFTGMDDVPEEVCDDCFSTNLDAHIRRFRTCAELVSPDAVCSVCGGGGPGHGADRA